MEFFLSHPLIVITYGFLFLSVLLIWCNPQKNIPLWLISLVLAIGFGLSCGVLNIIVLPIIFLSGVAIYAVQQSSSSLILRILTGIVTLIIGFAASWHIVPGIHNFRVLHNVFISPDGAPFTLYFNFDEVMVAILIIGFSQNLIDNFKDFTLMIKQSLPIAFILILILMCPALLLHFVHFDAKFSIYFWIWAPTNLLFTCIAEEAFYRGFMQKYLTQIFVKIPFGQVIAILITSIVFGFRHTGKFDGMMLMATIAGLGYGYAYAKTKRIESSILVHFIFNLTHFLLFTYPVLLISIK